MRKYEEPRTQRFWMHAVLIVVSLSIVAGRIATVINPEGTAAFLSANDRSRWTTVAALVEKRTWAIDDLISIRSPRGHRLWDTIDKVRHVGRDGRLHYYSSKPTLLTSLVAGVYWTVHAVTGLTMTEQPIYVPRLLLLLINIPLLALFLITMALSIEWSSATDFAKRFVMTAACFATFATPFAISLNNHLFAVAATSLTLFIYLRSSEKIHDWFGGMTYRPRFVPWAIAGASAAFTVACELPALSMFVLWAVLFALLTRRSMPGFLCGAAVVAVGMFGTNYWAHQTWKTPYAHRSDGAVVQEFAWTLDPAASDAQRAASLQQELAKLERFERADSIAVRKLESGGFEVIAEFGNDTSATQQIWKVQRSDRSRPLTTSPGPSETHGPSETQSPAPRGGAAATVTAWELATWDDWYEYPRSYWRTGQRSGVDQGQPSRVVYAFHASLGHYGVFSLTPIWLLMPLGLVYRCTHGPRDRRYLAYAITLATLVCAAFYIARPEIDRNYGGVSVCFRWMLWFTPLWLYAIIPELNKLSESERGRCIAMLLVAASIFSVSTSLDSPWQSPWLYRFATFLGWMN